MRTSLNANGHLLTRLLAAAILCVCVLIGVANAQSSQFEGRTIGEVKVVVDPPFGNSVVDDILPLVADLSESKYSSIAIHDAILRVYNQRPVVSVEVAAALRGELVDLEFRIKRKTVLNKVLIDIHSVDGDDNRITEQELLFKLNILSSGTAITEQMLRNNADIILDFLRDQGYYKAEIAFEQQKVAGMDEVNVLFHVTLNQQAKVDTFSIGIDGLSEPIDLKELSLKPGENFSRDRLRRDVEKIRSILREGDFVAPRLNEPRVVYDPELNKVAIELTGSKGPRVKIVIDPKTDEPNSRTLRKILPIKREGTLDFAAIVEGERRLENYYQEHGYFFVDVTPACSVEPSIIEGDGTTLPNGTEFVCSALATNELLGREIEVKYNVALSRKLRLSKIRIRGTNKLSYEEISSVLNSQQANILGIIPLFGYGRGVTSADTLEEDASTIRSLMNELGYRNASVSVRQGVSPNSDDLIITFQVDEGPPTVVDDVTISGNSAISTDELKKQLPELVGRNYSRARVRNAVRSLQTYYSDRGYYDARVTSSIVEPVTPATVDAEKIKVEFHVEGEGQVVTTDRVLITGNRKTKESAIRRAIAIEPGKVLKASEIYTSEQSLFGTDAFDSVNVKLQPSGGNGNGSGSGRKTDVIINVSEAPPRVLGYGGGFSTDLGVNGFFDIRHVNLFGRLWQGGARLRMSRRQQLVQLDFVHPRFLHDREGRFSPLTITAQYQRDSTVTRFFRSAFDKGTFGIVQRLDSDGNPIDEFGNAVGSPTLNRLTFTVETSKTLSVKNRSLIFARFKFEDVRLMNFESLLVSELLRPDSRIRTSGFSFTYVRDTRKNCQIKYSLLETIAKGEPGDRCRYNASDPTNGSYITAQYDLSTPLLGANIGFQKFQASYNYYYSIPRIRRMTIAARAVIGLAHVFSNGNRFSNSQFPGLDGILPISERFFAGGSTTLRGFDFEEAGPRAVIVPQGTFRNSKGQQVYLDPFTLPFGGNGLAVVNIEARIPLSKSLRAVPFYDGGNVFRRVGDIFNPPKTIGSTAFEANLRALWTNTIGLGLRLKTPIGGEFGVDYGYLLNPPRFRIPQTSGPDAYYRLHQGQLHFRFSQAF
ncbi:MAG: BamA/TamA family outer membrane protein [Pyrinomonadaceae bacterium]|nr:BamA/TamA family outer membrane protein [Pyrinomonadaceae bacterium]